MDFLLQFQPLGFQFRSISKVPRGGPIETSFPQVLNGFREMPEWPHPAPPFGLQPVICRLQNLCKRFWTMPRLGVFGVWGFSFLGVWGFRGWEFGVCPSSSARLERCVQRTRHPRPPTSPSSTGLGLFEGKAINWRLISCSLDK